ncbi:hypothetical protein QVD17_09614 [Tagetes erecta]|uniref:Uncharacterized protein n=1 Tax=Tagetes erecta TaxID=13708 RepID=A0AAD8L4P3_TARER|nr:hypothetical protein QVD17_09614 [Tagetes erecta]
MKREGRQHGIVRILNPASLSRQRFVKMADTSSTMGLFAKVPTKPTNRSKFTGKCRKPRCNGCHLHPVCKSRAKAKGTMKLRSIDHESELTRYSFGTSATGVLAYLADDGYGYENDDYDYDNYEYHNRVEESYNYGYGYDRTTPYDHSDDNISHDVEDEDDDEDDETMSFCDVGLCWGHEDGDGYGNDNDNDDDGWYLVGGQM